MSDVSRLTFEELFSGGTSLHDLFVGGDEYEWGYVGAIRPGQFLLWFGDPAEVVRVNPSGHFITIVVRDPNDDELKQFSPPVGERLRILRTTHKR